MLSLETKNTYNEKIDVSVSMRLVFNLHIWQQCSLQGFAHTPLHQLNSFGAKFQTTFVVCFFVCFFFHFDKLSFGKTFISKVARLNVKQRRSR